MSLVVCDQLFLIDSVTFEWTKALQSDCPVTWHQPPLLTSRGFKKERRRRTRMCTTSISMVSSMCDYGMDLPPFTILLRVITAWHYCTFTQSTPDDIVVLINSNYYRPTLFMSMVSIDLTCTVCVRISVAIFSVCCSSALSRVTKLSGLRPLGDRHLSRLQTSSRLILGQFVSLLVLTRRLAQLPVRSVWFTLLGEFYQTMH